MGIPSHARRAHRQRLSSSLVTVSDFDIKMHYYLSSALPSGVSSRHDMEALVFLRATDIHSLSIHVPIPFTPIDVTDTDGELFQYCRYPCTACAIV